MKYLNKRAICLTVLAVLLALPVCATIASAQQDLDPLFIMSAGSAKQDNFYVNDVFTTEELGPIALATIVALPSGEVNPDTLTITITPKANESKSFTYKSSYMLIGFSYALNGTPVPIIVSNSYPIPIVKKVTIQSTFGFATIGLIVTSVKNLDPADVIPPFSFTIKVELSAMAPPAAEK